MSVQSWLAQKRTLYTTAVANAKSASSGNLKTAWDAIQADNTLYDTTGDGTANATIKSLLPDVDSSKFSGSSPTATVTEIAAFETWLNANSTEAGYLGLSTLSGDNTALNRKPLGKVIITAPPAGSKKESGWVKSSQHLRVAF